MLEARTTLLMLNVSPVMLTKIATKSSFMCLQGLSLTNWTIYRFGGPIDVRDRLVKVRQICLTALNEQQSCEANKTLSKDTKKYSAHTLKGVETDLQSLEKQIKELIDSDPYLKPLFENITAPAARLYSRSRYYHCGKMYCYYR
jgi:hypothetical protein